MRGGAVAVSYHGVYIVAFFLMGVGLWRATWWGHRAVLIGTAIYVLDKALYLLDDAARAAEMSRQARGYGQIFELVDQQFVHRLVTWTTLVLVASWIGFALYVHLRRDYFRCAQNQAEVSTGPTD